MEKMPFYESMAVELPMPTRAQKPAVVSSDWTQGLPVLASHNVTLRELRLSDAASLLAMLSNEEVARFISPPPTTVQGFERFITWAHAERQAGRYVCFAVVPAGTETAVGIFQVRQLEPNFHSGEWGFVVGQPYWGTGLFMGGAQLVLEYLFGTIGVRRLEARTVVNNSRANGALTLYLD